MKTGFKGALWGAVSAGVANGIGTAFSGGGASLAHGLTRAAISKAQGGKYSEGFWSGFASSALGGTIGKFKTMEGQVSMAAIVGGTASKLGGGKFANGAVSGAFVHMYNAAGHGAKRQYNREKIDFFEYERKWWSDFFNATDDFISNYTDMRTANTIGADKYFHCTANCQATNRGDGGWNAARFISETRELTDYHIKGDPLNACNEDRVANIQGQRGGECRGTCNGFRPLYLDEQW